MPVRRVNPGMAIRRMLVFAVLLAAIFSIVGCSKGDAVAERNKPETLATGTSLGGSLQKTIETGKNKNGDKVTLRTTQEVRLNQMTIGPAGATSNGDVPHND